MTLNKNSFSLWFVKKLNIIKPIISKEKYKVKFFIQKGFTLAELIISVAIGSIVLVFVFSFVTDAIQGLAETSKKTKVLNEFYEFVTKMDNYTNTFITGSVVIDSPVNSGFDILMLKNYNSTAGVLLWVVDAQNLKLAPNSQYGYYGNRILGYRDLTASNIATITSTPSTAYDLQFYDDKVFRELVTKDLQVDYYNTGSILDIETSILLKYAASLEGSLRSTISQENKSDIFRVNLNF